MPGACRHTTVCIVHVAGGGAFVMLGLFAFLFSFERARVGYICVCVVACMCSSSTSSNSSSSALCASGSYVASDESAQICSRETASVEVAAVH
jgi:hypothetical protein